MAVITDINQLDLTKSYTYADYLTWQFDEMVELIKGKIFKMSPAPLDIHQRVSGNLYLEIGNYIKKQKCQIRTAPYDVRFVRNIEDKVITTVTQPDICVICDPSKIDAKGCLGAPDFIIEIISASTKQKDIKDKFYLYEEFGVKEYWIVFPNDQIIEVFILENGKYLSKGKFMNDDKIPVNTLQGLEINVNEIFEN